MSAAFHGSITALITPFKDGAVDYESFEKFIRWQADEGSHGVVPSGTTGESPTLDYDETKRIFEVCVQAVKSSGKKLPVIAGTGSNATREAIELSRIAERAGADALLSVTPYYNKPSQAGLFAHFSALHDATDLPILLYSVPGRCGIELSVDTVQKLAELPRIVGLKDATADAARTTILKKRLGNEFMIFSGEDALAGAYLAQGADGCISVTANVAPRLCAEFQDAWRNGDRDQAMAIQSRLLLLHKAMFVETSPSPVKYACHRLGLCGEDVRLPLLPVSAASRREIDDAMTEAGLIAATPAAIAAKG